MAIGFWIISSIFLFKRVASIFAKSSRFVGIRDGETAPRDGVNSAVCGTQIAKERYLTITRPASNTVG